MTLPSAAPAISPVRSERPAAAIPPAESIVIECIARAHGLGRAALTNLAIAQGCPSLRLDYLQRAAERLADASDELADALAAQRLRHAAGEPDGDASATIISSATNEAGRIIEATDGGRPAQSGPSIRCNDCYAPDNRDCAECRERNAEHDVEFNQPTRHADPAR